MLILLGLFGASFGHQSTKIPKAFHFLFHSVLTVLTLVVAALMTVLIKKDNEMWEGLTDDLRGIILSISTIGMYGMANVFLPFTYKKFKEKFGRFFNNRVVPTNFIKH